MATENPRVAAYPPQRVYSRLVEFRRERGLKSDSAAIVAILEAYFFGGSFDERLSESPGMVERIEDLEGKLRACLRWWLNSGRQLVSVQLWLKVSQICPSQC